MDRNKKKAPSIIRIRYKKDFFERAREHFYHAHLRTSVHPGNDKDDFAVETVLKSFGRDIVVVVKSKVLNSLKTFPFKTTGNNN